MNEAYLPTVRQLQAFIAVFRLRKLVAAAAQLFITQSAVSVLIRQLEEGLGVRLFDRTTRSLQPTEAAHEAMVIAERILRDLDTLSAGCRDARDLRRGQVSLAITPTLASMLLPVAVHTFAQEHPGIQIHINDCAPDQFVTRIVGEQVDFGIGTPERAGVEVQQQTLIRDQLAVVCYPDHPLARLSKVRWADLADHPVIAGRPGYGVRRLVDLSAAQAGVELRVASEVSFLSTALWLTDCGMAAAIMPSAYAKQSAYRRLVVKTLHEPRVPRDVYVVTKQGRHLSPACEAFLHTLRMTIKGVG